MVDTLCTIYIITGFSQITIRVSKVLKRVIWPAAVMKGCENIFLRFL